MTEFSNSSDSEESSWINILRNRKNRRRIKYRHRMKRSSSTRTIVSVNSDDNRRQKSSNSKCQKYAMFEVNKHFTLNINQLISATVYQLSNMS